LVDCRTKFDDRENQRQKYGRSEGKFDENLTALVTVASHEDWLSS